MSRESFIFYGSWVEAVRDLPNEVRLEIYDGIMEYAISGKCPDFKPMAKIAFNFIKNDIDRANQKYEERIRVNRENGSKGGRPKKPKETQNNPSVFSETQQNPNKNDNEYDNDILLEKESKGVEVEESVQEEKKEIEEPVINPDEEKEKSCAKKEKEIIEYFHEQCSLLPKVQIVGETRKKAIKARIKDVGVERVMQVIRMTGESSFLNGKNDRGWSADFDWIMKPTNFTKILEGNYINRTNGHNQTTSTGAGNKGSVQTNQVQRRNNQFTIDDFTVPS